MTANRLPSRRRELAHGLQREGKRLDRADDDLLAPGERICELAALARALALDRRDDALGALEVGQRLLELAVDHVAVGDDDHGREQFLVCRVVQVREEMRRPCDGVRLARSGRVLDQIFLARPLREHGGAQAAGGVELVIAGEDQRLDLPLRSPAARRCSGRGFRASCRAPRPPPTDSLSGARSGSAGCPRRRRCPC